MEEKMSVKVNAPELLDKQLALRARKKQYGIIVLSSSTDPYLQAEKDTVLTRTLLEIILRHKFPLHIITRSNLIIRDFDLLKQISRDAILPDDLKGKVPQPLFITYSFSSLDDATAHIFEPGATPPSLRLQVLQQTLSEGFFSGVSMMPLLPWISDTGENLEKMYDTFSRTGVHYLFPASLTLFGSGPTDSKTLVFRAIEKHYPHLLEKYSGYFSNSDEMPYSYTSALHRKTKSLSEKYKIPDRII